METEEKKQNAVWEFIKFVFISVVIVVLFRTFVAQPFIVNGASMQPTFENGDYLIVDELTYRLREPKKGEVVVFRFPLEPSKFFIKRIIGIPGEKVDINGKEVTLNNDEYFVMGDNRAKSFDSRRWGALKKDLLVGRAFLRLWPFNNIEIMPGMDEEIQ